MRAASGDFGARGRGWSRPQRACKPAPGNYVVVVNPKTFSGACCGHFHCPPEAFAERVLWHCHHRRALLLGRLLWRFDRHFYDADLEMIRSVADCTTTAELSAEVSSFRYHNQTHGFWRKFLHVRLSGQRLVDLGSKLLG